MGETFVAQESFPLRLASHIQPEEAVGMVLYYCDLLHPVM